jgi:SHS2 domain-containing protein
MSCIIKVGQGIRSGAVSAMSYRVFDHTADLGIEVAAATIEALQAEAVLALFDCLAELGSVRAGQTREIEATGNDEAETLVNLLREALFAFNGGGFLGKTCHIRRAGPAHVQALLRGELFDPGRHRLLREIKAVTYHQALVRREGAKWVARVVCDV